MKLPEVKSRTPRGLRGLGLRARWGPGTLALALPVATFTCKSYPKLAKTEEVAKI